MAVSLVGRHRPVCALPSWGTAAHARQECGVSWPAHRGPGTDDVAQPRIEVMPDELAGVWRIHTPLLRRRLPAGIQTASRPHCKAVMALSQRTANLGRICTKPHYARRRLRGRHLSEPMMRSSSSSALPHHHLGCGGAGKIPNRSSNGTPPRHQSHSPAMGQSDTEAAYLGVNCQGAQEVRTTPTPRDGRMHGVSRGRLPLQPGERRAACCSEDIGPRGGS